LRGPGIEPGLPAGLPHPLHSRERCGAPLEETTLPQGRRLIIAATAACGSTCGSYKSALARS